LKVHSLTIVVPAYNEEKSLEASVASLVQSAEQVIPSYEIIVVNDGSRDRTGILLDQLCQRYPKVKAIHHQQNQMIGGSFLSALRQASASHVILVPVDNPLSAEMLNRFIQSAENADIVVGKRDQRTGYKIWMSALSKIYWLFCVLLFRVHISDFTWISLYDREKILKLSPQFTGICIFPEILVKASGRGLKLTEIKCPMIARKTGKATVSRIPRIVHLFLETFRLWRHITFDSW
jgi:glycosyltransferase involved in cell wall biosynthesis